MDQLVPPPPSATDQNNLPPLDISMKQGKQNNTLSTKTSTDHLICKTPQESQIGSEVSVKGAPRAVLTPNRILICLGALQFLLGFLMVLFGMYVIAYKASLSHVSFFYTLINVICTCWPNKTVPRLYLRNRSLQRFHFL